MYLFLADKHLVTFSTCNYLAKLVIYSLGLCIVIALSLQSLAGGGLSIANSLSLSRSITHNVNVPGEDHVSLLNINRIIKVIRSGNHKV